MNEKEFASEVESRRERIKASVSYWVGSNCPDLEDLIQEVLVGAWEQREKLRPEGIEGYLVRVARNVSANYLKNKRKEVELNEDHTPSGGGDPAAKLILEEAIDKLPPQYKRIIKLKSEGWGIVEIASLEGVAPSAISQKMSRAKKLLKELLDG